jgi:hypothetical protein
MFVPAPDAGLTLARATKGVPRMIRDRAFPRTGFEFFTDWKLTLLRLLAAGGCGKHQFP